MGGWVGGGRGGVRFVRDEVLVWLQSTVTYSNCASSRSSDQQHMNETGFRCFPVSFNRGSSHRNLNW